MEVDGDVQFKRVVTNSWSRQKKKSQVERKMKKMEKDKKSHRKIRRENEKNQ